MKALLVLSDNIYLTPYLSFYKDILEKGGYQFTVFYWDKNQNEEPESDRYIRFQYDAKDKISKILGYLKFRKTLLDLIKKGKYDIIIPLHSVVYICLYRLLKNKYKHRFIFDIRDYSYEKYALFRKMEKDLANKSLINIISSKGYINFLPKAEYFIVHNIPRVDCSRYVQTENRNGTMNLSFIGLIRFMEQNKKIIRFFQGDNRFNLSFIGTNAEQLREYCEQIGAKNVELIDTFDSSKTLDYYQKADAILNLYGNHTPLLDYALSNKLYFSASTYKPILVCEDTYMEKIATEYGIGFTVRMTDPKERDALYSFLINLDRPLFIDNCINFMKMAIQEDRETHVELLNRLTMLEKQL